MKHLKLNSLLIALLFSVTTLISCNDDDDNVTPITLGSGVTVTNTFQSTGFTQGAELAVEGLFQMPAGSLAATANVSEGVEFPNYLLNLYNINISENSIFFEVAAEQNDPTYGNLFRILETDTYDRYYFTFNEAQNVNGFTSSNPSVNLRIDSNKVLIVEIGENYDFNPNQSFTITLN